MRVLPYARGAHGDVHSCACRFHEGVKVSASRGSRCGRGIVVVSYVRSLGSRLRVGMMSQRGAKEHDRRRGCDRCELRLRAESDFGEPQAGAPPLE